MIDNYNLTFKGRKFWMNFELPLDIKGGPFREIVTRPKTESLSICLKEEASQMEKGAANIFLPIQDFSVPKPSEEDKVKATVLEALQSALKGKTVYAGCMGGTGRTGLLFALMAKAAGHRDVVKYVRANYRPHAVETRDQERYVQDMNLIYEFNRLNNEAFSIWVKKKLRSFIGR